METFIEILISSWPLLLAGVLLGIYYLIKDAIKYKKLIKQTEEEIQQLRKDNKVKKY